MTRDENEGPDWGSLSDEDDIEWDADISEFDSEESPPDTVELREHRTGAEQLVFPDG